MNYITSCPKCETHFLLNDELIKAHRGKVQCGSCEHVFNAKNRLTEVADDVTSADEYQAGLEENVEIHEEPTLFDDLDAITTTSTETPNFAESGEIPAENNINLETDTAKPIEASKTLESNAPSIIDDFTKSLEPPKSAKKHTLLFSCIAILLALMAAMQVIYHSRVQIAAEYPQFKPILLKSCALVNCSIDLPKHLDLITIGDSDMQEDDRYQSVINFSSSLKNNASFPQSYPNIELTLTDAEDNIVIKKLIPPESYLTDQKKIKVGLAANEVSAIKLALHVKDASVAGYRILLVY